MTHIGTRIDSRIQKVQELRREVGKPVQLPLTLLMDAHSSEPLSGGQEEVIRIVIAERETIFRDSLRIFLQMVPEFDVVGGCSDGEAALALIPKLMPGILLLESCNPHRESLDVLRAIKDSGADVKVILMCQTITKQDTVRALQMGARGIVLKTEPADSLVECIHKVVQGEYGLGKDGVTSLVEVVCETDDFKRAQKNQYGLTPRECEVITAVLEGYSNPEIAANLSLSEQTVKHHLSHIFDKLGVYSRLELALFAVNHSITCD